ncbi:MAG: RHS repeat protein, partial [Anaerolineae bacterium]|nr:RHS repeat protein [Anaerolineae bacterium]
MNDPDMGVWTYEYNAAGNLTEQRDANLARLCFTYDSLDRLTYKRHDSNNNGCQTNDTQLAAYSYGTSAANSNLGRLISVADASGSHTFSYDSRGRLSSETRTLTGAPAAYTMSYGYDDLDRLTSQTYPNDETVTTTYNNQGLPNYLSGSNTYVDTAQYNRMGQMKLLDLGNGLKTYYGYLGYQPFAQNDQYDATWGQYGYLWRICTAPDASARCLEVNKGLPATDQRLDIRYSFDPAGNVNAIRDYLNDNQVQWFSYDHRNRLETAYTDAVGVGQYSYTGEANDYDYNEIGNISSFGGGSVYNYVTCHATGCPGHPTTYTLPHAVKQIGANYFYYDGNGNMTKRVEGGVTYTQNFNVENRLTSVVKSGGGGTTTFVYDADGQRMKTVEPSGKTIYYPFPGFEVEVNGPVTMKRVTYSLGGQTIAQRELGLGLAENYDDGNSTGWTAHSGSWSMQNTGAGYAYRQTNTANNATNSSYALTQSGAMAYEWQATFNSGSTAGGLHFMASTAADTNHGNSYLVWQDATSMRIHESVANTLSPAKATVSLPASNGQTYQYRVTYSSGTITVWRNGTQVLSWTDSSPLTSGSYIAL